LNLPITTTFIYGQMGILVYDGSKRLCLRRREPLIRITATNAWKSEFTYELAKCPPHPQRIYLANSAGSDQRSSLTYDGTCVIQERDAVNAPAVTYTRGNDLSRRAGKWQAASAVFWLERDVRTDSTAFFHADRLWQRYHAR